MPHSILFPLGPPPELFYINYFEYFEQTNSLFRYADNELRIFDNIKWAGQITFSPSNS